jgi:hypothetical protein
MNIQNKIQIGLCLVASIYSTHSVMAVQCSGSVYVAPTTTDCSCGGSLGYSCDAGGDQINGYNMCGSTVNGGTNCISTSGVIGITKTCTLDVDWVEAASCAASASSCLIDILTEDWDEYLSCITESGVECVFCGNIISCTESDTDIMGQIYVGIQGTCIGGG